MLCEGPYQDVKSALNDALKNFAHRRPGNLSLLAFLLDAGLFRAFFTGPVYCSGNGETSEKQVAMIAQKIMDANQAQKQRSGLVSLPNSRTATFWTPLRDHFP
jgi:hypothetical protein